MSANASSSFSSPSVTTTTRGTTDRTDKPRVALIVDHPARDLPGLVLLAVELCKAGVTCHLVSQNLATREIWRLAPDFVLLNYYRKHKRDFYASLSDAGIALGVLDTEGGVFEDLDEIDRLVVQDKAERSNVSCYCCWSPTVAQYLVDGDWFDAEQVFVTGCPKLDFLAERWKEVTLENSPYASPYEKNLILVNSVFSAGNPGMISKEKQREQLAKAFNLSPDESRAWQDRDMEGLRQLTSLTNSLARRFPNATFVYRPHPFERMETCQELLAPLDNLHCVREGTVDGWILRAKAVVQAGCSTAIEAGMAGVPALLPRWVPTCSPRPTVDEASIPFESEEDLAHALAAILDGQFQSPDEHRHRLENVIREWFYKVDGKAYARVAEVILNHLPTSRPQDLSEICRRHNKRTDPLRVGHKNWFRAKAANALATFGLPGAWCDAVAPRPFDNWDRSPKFYDAHSVQSLVDLIRGCRHAEPSESHQRLTVRAAEVGQDYCHGQSEGRSVVISPAPSSTDALPEAA